LRGARDPALLLERDGLGGTPESAASATLDLDEAEDPAVFGDQIDLAVARAGVPFEDPITPRDQGALGVALPVVADSAAAAGTRRQSSKPRGDAASPLERHHRRILRATPSSERPAC